MGRHPYDATASAYNAAKIEDQGVVFPLPDGALPDREQMMDLRQMEAVVSVADAVGCPAWARRLHVVQSAVSSTVRVLERERGTPWFDHTMHRVALTPGLSVPQGVDRSTTLEVNDIGAAAELVSKDVGVCIMPESIAAHFPDLPQYQCGRHAPNWKIMLIRPPGEVPPTSAGLSAPVTGPSPSLMPRTSPTAYSGWQSSTFDRRSAP
ncbi:LysR family transcriptional regulator [Streptomyces sp900116325]|uniref:LysR family transcriptional regulator n=1 Tax=Streptomyces sp. 900116325 TaxID=3154295 RepID=UPI0033B80D14